MSIKEVNREEDKFDEQSEKKSSFKKKKKKPHK
jgi:hypothetical protein